MPRGSASLNPLNLVPIDRRAMKKKDLALDLLEMALARKAEPVALATALIALDRLTQARPEHAEAHYASGRVLMLLDQAQLALGAFRIAQAHAPDHVSAKYFEAICMWQLGLDAQLVLRKLREVRFADPNHFEAWFDEGQVLQNMGDDLAALDCFDLAQALRPGDFGALKKKLQLQLRLGLWDHARRTHERLRALWVAAPDAATRSIQSYVLDQFDLGAHTVLGIETFAPSGDPRTLFSFLVTRVGQLEFSVNLESSAALREAGFGWVLVIQDGDIRVSTEHRYTARPGYHLLRPQVMILISDWVTRRGEPPSDAT